MAVDHSTASFPTEVCRIEFGSWLTGFADGEGCFHLGWETTKKSYGTYLRPRVGFSITLRDDDRNILLLIRSFFSCGAIYVCSTRLGNPAATYKVDKYHELFSVIIPHFIRHPLRSKKLRDFTIWKEAVALARTVSGRHQERTAKGSKPKWSGSERDNFDRLISEIKETRTYKSHV